MTYVVAFLGALVVLLIVLLVIQQRTHNSYVAELFAAFRGERAALIDKITMPGRSMAEPRSGPVITSRRSPEQQREFARVGTVAAPRDPEPDED